MKKLTIVIGFAVLLSCNPKAKIVEEIKIYKDSVLSVREAIYQLDLKRQKKYSELFYSKGGFDLKKYEITRLRVQYEDYKNKTEVETWKLKFKQGRFEKIIDSLELELKKY